MKIVNLTLQVPDDWGPNLCSNCPLNYIHDYYEVEDEEYLCKELPIYGCSILNQPLNDSDKDCPFLEELNDLHSTG